MESYTDDIKYNFIEVYGHPGSHFEQIETLLKSNFKSCIHETEQFELKKEIIIEPDILYFYIEDKFRDILNELYNMRVKFGISEQTLLEGFHNSLYSNMCCKNCACNMFVDIKMSPRTYWEECVNCWINLSNKYENVSIIFYHKFLDNQKVILLDISKKINNKLENKY